MRILTLITVMLLSPALSPAAETASTSSFPKIWFAIYENSPEIKARELSHQSAAAASDRLARHWVPRLRAELKAFNTDDPTSHLMNTLGERQITAHDFTPTELNAPGAHFYTQSTVGAELPLYEGGQSEAAVKAQSKVAQARQIQLEDTRLTQYVQALQLYGELIALNREKQSLLDLDDKTSKSIANYRLGAKGNPVGYGGLLALKSAKNKLQAQMNSVELQIDNNIRSLSILSGQQLSNFSISNDESLPRFLEVYAPGIRDTRNAESPSRAVKTQVALAEAARHKARAENAKVLPQVGLFAQDTLYTGERGSSSGYAAGAYLRWNLGATDVGAAKEARLEASALEAQADAQRLNDRVRNETAQTSLRSLERTLKLLDDNGKLLTEQWNVSENLFRNGTLTAHQLAEILSKTSDLLDEKLQTERAYLTAKAALLARTEFDSNPENIRSLK